MKTADAGYLTRRLVDVAHDVIINDVDCGTLRGLVCSEIKKNDEVVVSLGERILGRVSVHDIIDPISGGDNTVAAEVTLVGARVVVSGVQAVLSPPHVTRVPSSRR